MAFVAGAEAQQKSIRLRSETIRTERLLPGVKSQVAEKPLSGLILVQFTGPIEAAWRAELAQLGVSLLHYVPEDSFVARASGVTGAALQALPYIHWVGPYQPEHKLHAGLLRAKAAEDVAVSVVLAADGGAKAVSTARKSFGSVMQQSRFRFGTVLRGRITGARLRELAQSQDVLWIEPAPRMRLYDEVASGIVAGVGSGNNQTAMMELGYDGSGVTVAVADSGLDSGEIDFMHPDLEGRVAALFHYGDLEDAADEHSHGTHVAGIVAGNGATGELDEDGFLYGLGVAPGASIVGQRIFDGVGNYTLEDPFSTLTRDAKSAGADIGSNSWGDDTQGRYDVSAMEFDALVRDADLETPGDQPYILEFSAGNAGPGTQTIGSPAVAKNVIATGATQNDRPDLLIYGDGPDAMADFSSRGPCEDGRIKPDITAPGTWIASLRSIFANDEFAWGPISDFYMYQGGTSQAGPHASGAAAVFVQYWRQTHTNATPSPALVKAALINSAVDMDETAMGSPLWGDDGDFEVPVDPEFLGEMNYVPNMDEGWGRIDLTELIGSARDYAYVDQSVTLATGQQYEQRVLVETSDEPLRITLGYTDVPGFAGAIVALVNDLDLEVVSPNGQVYGGNQFALGESMPDLGVSDAINNIECVYLAAPLPGEYLVRVRARSVPGDARADTAEVDQDFALVISAKFAVPGSGIVTFDRPAYSSPATMRLSLVDYDLASQPTASIQLRSKTEPAGETLVLRAQGATGLFTGSVATATGPAVPDGRLQIAHGDSIEAVYQDAQPAGTRTFTAAADLVAPVISSVVVTNAFAQGNIEWLTDEPAMSFVLYGTNASLGQVMTNRTFTTNHSAAIPDQISGRTYYFRLVCADPAGNRVTNAQLFQFVAPFAPAVLVVDGFFGDGVYSTPPIANYTRPLDQLGLGYDVWNVQARGSPTITSLRPYRVVLWRIAEANQGRPTGFTAGEQATMTQYFNEGGSLFIASMEVLSRLGVGSAFTRDVLHVASFDEDVTVPEALGVMGDPIGDDLYLTMSYEYYGFFGLELDFSDTFTPGPGAEGILTQSESGDYVGLRYPRSGVDSPGRVVFLSFPFDAIPESDPAPDNRVTFLRRVLLFLAPGLNGEGQISFNRAAFTIPSQLTAEVADSDLEGAGQITVPVFSNTEPGGKDLTLVETSRRGVFRGSLSLVATNSGSAELQLLVQPGDTVQASYYDASVGGTVSVSAEVEIIPPGITNIDVEAGYVDAVVMWDTSELADSLVEFGDSPLLGRTAADENQTEFHALALDQLQPDSLYYYRITSRDRAGNVSTTEIRTFRTEVPAHPPWVDDLEGNAEGWSVYTVEDSQRGWELGPPGFLSPPAYSPVNAWGSNLSGDYADQIESFLISPAILLTGGNTVTLRFAQAYDFGYASEQDIFHAGEILIVTNNALSPIAIAEFSDEVADWHEVEYDLSAYAGQIVYVVWHYFLFSLDAVPRMGWLLDDVSVTVTNLPVGVIQISNNLSQASFKLDGASTRNGQGSFLEITNALPGEYVLTFNPVPYYITPPPLTNTLAASNTLLFRGEYTFVDANTNGIPDSWEQQTFGHLLAPPSAEQDSNFNGISDYAEFIAGRESGLGDLVLRWGGKHGKSAGALRFEWLAVAGREYRIVGSVDAEVWQPVTRWLAKPPGPAAELLSATNNLPAQFFRLEVRLSGGNAAFSHFMDSDGDLMSDFDEFVAGTNPTNKVHALRLSAMTAPGSTNAVLQWQAALGRSYRVLGSTNLLNWAPLTDWRRTSAGLVSTNLPVSSQLWPRFFRLEVKP